MAFIRHRTYITSKRNIFPEPSFNSIKIEYIFYCIHPPTSVSPLQKDFSISKFHFIEIHFPSTIFTYFNNCTHISHTTLVSITTPLTNRSCHNSFAGRMYQLRPASFQSSITKGYVRRRTPKSSVIFSSTCISFFCTETNYSYSLSSSSEKVVEV